MQLLERGRTVVAAARDADKAKEVFTELGLSEGINKGFGTVQTSLCMLSYDPALLSASIYLITIWSAPWYHIVGSAEAHAGLLKESLSRRASWQLRAALTSPIPLPLRRSYGGVSPRWSVQWGPSLGAHKTATWGEADLILAGLERECCRTEAKLQDC